ncbi:hypothetical protein Lser_V15G05068 [Lactuca serriola]
MRNTSSKISIPVHTLTMLMMLSFRLASPCPTYIQGVYDCYNGWNHFTCNNGSVVQININITFSSFPSLEMLKISDTFLEGNNLHQIGLLRNLTYVSLTLNYYIDTLPLFFTNLTRLEYLDLSGNYLSGNLSSQSLKNLKFLDLSHNWLTGPIPQSFDYMVNLTQLEHPDLSANYFSGNLPSQLWSLKNLKFLDLSHNQLTGPILQSFASMVNLTRSEHLALSGNRFIGTLPSQLGNLRNLKYLDVSKNQLRGAIPQELGNLQKLETLSLGDNLFQGPIPSAMGSLSQLIILNLSMNNISGPIPPHMEYRYLKQLDLNHNHLSGVIHLEFRNLPRLSHLDFSSNGLSGNKSQHELQIHGDVCSILNYDGTLAFDDFVKATEDFDLKYCIGTGGYGSVYEAKLPNGKTFALKKLHRFEAKQQEFQERDPSLNQPKAQKHCETLWFLFA